MMTMMTVVMIMMTDGGGNDDDNDGGGSDHVILACSRPVEGGSGHPRIIPIFDLWGAEFRLYEVPGSGSSTFFH